MMHDAVRADVLQALLSGGTGDQYTSAAADLQEHTAAFRRILDEVTAAHLSDDVDAAVEEQTATTTEMNRNVAEAAQSADQIAENIAAVASATGETTSAMGHAQTAIEEVARMASALHSSVSRFRY